MTSSCSRSPTAARAPARATGWPRTAGTGWSGMRERVRIYGGELETGARSGGGFRIRAKLPLVADAQTLEAV